jgi:hypothetical protein
MIVVWLDPTRHPSDVPLSRPKSREGSRATFETPKSRGFLGRVRSRKRMDAAGNVVQVGMAGIAAWGWLFLG